MSLELKPLLPDAKAFTDLFHAAIFVSERRAGWYHCFSGPYSPSRELVAAALIGGTRTYRILPDHSVIRGHYGAVFHQTYVQPTEAVFQIWKQIYGPITGGYSQSFVLTGFELVRWSDQRGIAVFAYCNHSIVHALLAMLPDDAADDFMALYPPDVPLMLAEERKRADAAWGHLIKAWNGREYASLADVPPNPEADEISDDDLRAAADFFDQL